MKLALLNACLIILMIGGLLLVGSSRLGSAQSTTNSVSSGAPPTISSVSPIEASVLQTITIEGSGFGDVQPQLLSLGDGSVDTVGGSDTPTIFILDQNPTEGWQAGIQKNSTWGSDSIGVILESWADNKIVLGGFGSALSTNGGGEWVISQGDPILIDVQTASGDANYTTTVGSSQPVETAAPGSGPPVISYVSPIADVLLQTITIQGSGFGNVPPQTQSLGDGSVDTINGGATPAMQVRDNCLINGWVAGWEESGIGVIIQKWSDNEIVLGGFGEELSTTGQGRWNMMPGDPIQILVMVSGQVASYSTAVIGPQQTPTTNGGPTISSVSPISTSLVQTITIKGSGFGDTQPQTMSLGDGSVDTVGEGSTPVIQIHDDGWYGWEAGTQDGPSTGADSIGIILDSWTNNQIVLGGFGQALNDGTGQWQLLPGDPIRVVVMTNAGVAVYDTKVEGVGNITSNSAPAPSTPKIAVSCQSSATLDSFRVDISGSLTDDDAGIPGAPILIAYSLGSGNLWQNLTVTDTDANGNFLAEWLPSVTGNFVLNATYAGNSTLPGTSSVVNLVITPYSSSQDTLNVFSVSSNSTVTDLAFNSTSGQLSFTVSGPSGTHGYADVYISKNLVNDTSSIEAFLDGNRESFTISSSGNVWVLHFAYHLCTHQITVDLNSPASAKINVTEMLQGIGVGAAVSLTIIVTLLLFLKKNNNKPVASL